MHKDINQAVFLCGGMGTRLRPYTDNMPKPMVEVGGKPFLYHLLDQFAKAGIKNFLILSGYFGEKIVDYFGDGSKFGWVIKYSHGPLDWETGERLYQAREFLDDVFFLMYSDNYCELNLREIVRKHFKSEAKLTLTLTEKKLGNICVDFEGMVSGYDNSRPGGDYKYVEIGYMLANKNFILSEVGARRRLGENVSLSKILKDIAPEKKINAFFSQNEYLSISDPKRYELACRYMSHKKIILIDRDGTINRKAPQGQYILNWEMFEWIPQTIAAMKQLAKLGYKFILITNQACVGIGLITREKVDEIHFKMTAELKGLGIEVIAVYVCEDDWRAPTELRKPQPGMFYRAAKEHEFTLNKVIYIGDDERDCYAAFNAGCGMVYLSDQSESVFEALFTTPFLRVHDMNESVEWIESIYSDLSV